MEKEQIFIKECNVYMEYDPKIIKIIYCKIDIIIINLKNKTLLKNLYKFQLQYRIILIMKTKK